MGAFAGNTGLVACWIASRLKSRREDSVDAFRANGALVVRDIHPDLGLHAAQWAIHRIGYSDISIAERSTVSHPLSSSPTRRQRVS